MQLFVVNPPMVAAMQPARSKSSREHYKMERFYEASVLQQGDRLLKEMLQLRKDLEKDKMAFDFSTKESKDTNNGPLPDYGPLEENEENILREKLEMMTLQIKKEIWLQLLTMAVSSLRYLQIGNEKFL